MCPTGKSYPKRRFYVLTLQLTYREGNKSPTLLKLLALGCLHQSIHSPSRYSLELMSGTGVSLSLVRRAVLQT